MVYSSSIFTQICGHLYGSVGLCLLQNSILSHLFFISDYFYYPCLVPTFLRVILSSSTFSFMSVTRRYQVDQGKWPQVIFKQLPLLQAHQRHKGKEPMFVQLPKNILEALFDPSSDLIDLSTPSSLWYGYRYYNGSTKEELKWRILCWPFEWWSHLWK